MGLKKVEALINHTSYPLEPDAGNVYQAKIAAPARRLKTSAKVNYYPVSVAAEDESGNRTVVQAGAVGVIENNLFPGEFIAADETGVEMGFVREDMEMDLDIGDTNDFELRLNIDQWSREKYWYGGHVFIPGTEYGGLLGDMEVVTKEGVIIWRGYTWRGLLMQKVIQPKAGEESLTLNGELNELIGNLLQNQFDSLFQVSNVNSGIRVADWKIEAYTNLYEALAELLASKGQRLQLEYVQGKEHSSGYVEIRAVPVTDWSDEIEYSQDSRIDFDIRDYKRGINHLICIGEEQDQNQEKQKRIIHLYIQKDGSVGNEQCYFGVEERVSVYRASTAEEEQLQADGSKRLKELRNYKKIQVSVDDVDLELGDIIAGRERITGTYLKKPVIGKILNASNGTINIEYRIEGDDQDGIISNYSEYDTRGSSTYICRR